MRNKKILIFQTSLYNSNVYGINTPLIKWLWKQSASIMWSFLNILERENSRKFAILKKKLTICSIRFLTELFDQWEGRMARFLTVLREIRLIFWWWLIDDLSFSFATVPFDISLSGWFERIDATLNWVSTNPFDSTQIVYLKIRKKSINNFQKNRNCPIKT